MTQKELLDKLRTPTEVENFYQEYYLARQNPKTLQAFLAAMDRNFIEKHHLQIPDADIMYGTAPYPEQTFFDMDQGHSIALCKHPNYSPALAHSHHFFEAQYVLAGVFTHTVSNRPITMKKGDFCLVSPDIEHNLHVFSDEVIVINLLIRRSTFEDIFFNLLRGDNILSSFFLSNIYARHSNDYILFHTGADERLRDMLLDLYLEFENQLPYCHEILNSQLITFFARLLRDYENSCELPAFTRKKDVQSYALIRFIQDQFRTVTLKDVATRFHYSEEYTSRLIKSTTGHTFSQLLRQIRLERAAGMLRDTNAPLAAICDEVGYLNPEHLIRIFKKAYGKTPSEYRKSF